MKDTAWQAWFALKEPHSSPLPNADMGGVDWERTLTPFQKLLMLRCCREEKMLFALTSYVAKEMGETYVTAPPLDMGRALADSAASIPIIFILSQGSDPTDGFMKWAEETHGRKVRSISLGQGQEKPAKLLIDSGKKAGDWVLLQNCHLGKSFMPGLLDIVVNLESDKQLRDDFRLWLTSSPATYFPVPILQTSIKLTNEAPSGMKANLLRNYSNIREEELCCFDGDSNDFNECSKSHAFKKLLFGASFFHALILERKKFGPLGWNVLYEWNDTDISTSVKWLSLFIKESNEIPWDSLLYIVGEINYGGRVTDPIDRRALHSILRRFFTPEILKEAYAFSESGIYRAPPSGGLSAYTSYIKSLPRVDEPEVFGMHENASIRYQLQESRELLKSVLIVQPRVTNAGGGVSPEDIVRRKAAEIVNSLPEILSLDEAGKTSLTVMENGLPNSISTVLRHEVEKFSHLQVVIRHTLVELDKALSGLTVLSANLDRMFQDFLSDTVPQLWSDRAYPSLKPLGSWMKDLLNRLDFIRGWLRNGEPHSFWLSGLYSPHGFMTGVLQSYARCFQVSVDILGLSFKVLEHDVEALTSSPSSGVFVHGLFSDSWRWNKTLGVMEDSRAGEMYSELPVIHFLPEEHHKV